MTIEFACGCGRKMKVPKEKAGSKGKCPSCGSLVQVPAAAALPGLELELEDERPSSGAPKVHEEEPMPGAPGVGGGSKQRESGRHKVAGGAQCPKCGKNYPADMLFCIDCGVDIMTGMPISGAIPGRGPGRSGIVQKTPDGFDEDMPFWKLALAAVYKPHKALALMPFFFERKDMRISMVVMYVASFIAVAITASALGRNVQPNVVVADPTEERIREMEKRPAVTLQAPSSWRKATDEMSWLSPGQQPFDWRFEDPTEPVEAGEPFNVNISFAEPGPGKGIAGDVYAMETESYKGPVSGEEWVRAVPGSQAGNYNFRLTQPLRAGSSWLFRLYEKGVDPNKDDASPRGFVHAEFPSKAGWAAKAVQDELSANDSEKKIQRLEKQRFRTIGPTEWTELKDRQSGLGEGAAPFRYKFLAPTGPVDSGTTLTIVVSLQEVDGVAVDASVFVSADVENLEVSASGESPFKSASASESGTYRADIQSAMAAGTSVAIWVMPKGTWPKSEGSQPRAVIRAQWKSKPGWAQQVVAKQEAEASAVPKVEEKKKVKKALKGPKGTFGAIVSNLANVGVAVLFFTLAARMLGGGGGFSMMLTVVAFLTAFANIAQIPVAFAPVSSQHVVQYVGWGYGILLYMIALIRVYDMNVTGALITNAIVFVLKFFVVDPIGVYIFGIAAA